MVKAEAYDVPNQEIAICHGQDKEALENAKAILEKTCGQAKTYVEATVGCAIGAHTGRGIVGICFFDKDEGPYKAFFE